MKKIILYLLLLTTFTFAVQQNIFIIKNKDGKVLKGKRINHVKNVYYDDLIKEQQQLIAAIRALKKKKNSHNMNSNNNENYDKKNLLANAKQHLGGTYVWGGTVPKGFDCSGYVQYIYKKEGVQLPRTAYAQSKVGKPITDAEDLIKGDLLFFLTDKSRNVPITHVGIYLGEDKFIHAASKKQGIIISSLSQSKYGKILVKATRIIK